MRDYDDLPTIVIERRSAGLGPFIWGALIGAGAALLLAPRSGEETQRDIRQRVQRAREAAESRVDRVTGAVTRTRARVQDTVERVQDTVERVHDTVDNVRSRFDGGRDSFDASPADIGGGERAARGRGVDVVITDVGEEPAGGEELE